MSASPYRPPRPGGPIELELSRNEGRAPRGLAEPGCERYPDVWPLREALARLNGVEPERVLVTAGGDDALLRACLATLGPGCEALVAAPTFEMIPRYVRVAGGTLQAVTWPEDGFPTDALVGQASDRTAVAFVVSPNNPTGAVATPRDVEEVARALPDALVVLDAAYGEFDRDDPTRAALQLDNVVVVRTLSKAWGLAGLRVGCLLGAPDRLERLEAAGNPYPVSSASARLACERLATGRDDVRRFVERVDVERARLVALLRDAGAAVPDPGRANFVLARGLDPERFVAALASRGIAVRAFPDAPLLGDAVRITLPGELAPFRRLERALQDVLRPTPTLDERPAPLLR